MIPIGPDTKIAALLKADSRSLDAIVSLSPAFKKLRNPVLRKVMAAVTTLRMAATIGGRQVADFYEVLRPLGFMPPADEKENPPAAVIADTFSPESLSKDEIHVLDVRPEIAAGNDPLQLILSHTRQLPTGHALKIINSFEPVPLLKLLQKQGFDTHAEKAGEELYYAWFRKKTEAKSPEEKPLPNEKDDWNAILEKYAGRIVSIDVRPLEMPGPMHAILEALETLPKDSALRVYHKKIPVFLLPELAQRGLQYRILEKAPGQVEMILFSV